MLTRTVVPDDWMPRGEAVVELRRPISVLGGIPGEAGLVRLMGRGAHGDRAAWLESEHPDPHRVEVTCDRYHSCGQCPLMHVDPRAQDHVREYLVSKALARIGVELEVRSHPSVAEEDWDYRHVVRLGFGQSDQGRLRLGLWSRHTGYVVPVPKCPVVTPTVRKVMMSLAHHALELELRPYHREREQGILRRALVRESRATGEVLVTLVAAKRIPLLRDYAEALAGGVSEIVGVWLHINSGPASEIFSTGEQGLERLQYLAGKGEIEEKIGDVRVRVGPGDILGVNPAAVARRNALVLDRLDVSEGKALVQFPSGVGDLVLQAAVRGAFAVGVEPLERAVGRAREVARRQELGALFLHGDPVVLEDVPRRLAGARPVVVMRPPREGSEELVEQLAALNPRRVAVLAEHPVSLGRTLVAWRERGFALEPVDLLSTRAHTTHADLVGVAVAPDADAEGRRGPRRRRVVRR